jgi:hypothetical protein
MLFASRAAPPEGMHQRRAGLFCLFELSTCDTSFPLCDPLQSPPVRFEAAPPAACAPATMRPSRLRLEVGRDIVSEIDWCPCRTPADCEV